METTQAIISRSPDVMSGAPVFSGTRVPVKNLLDYLAGGHTLGEFLDDFPTVSREQVLSVPNKRKLCTGKTKLRKERSTLKSQAA